MNRINPDDCQGCGKTYVASADGNAGTACETLSVSEHGEVASALLAIKPNIKNS